MSTDTTHQDVFFLPPIVLLAVGFILTLVWGFGNYVSIVTTEAWFLGKNGGNLIPIFLSDGVFNSRIAIAFFFAFIIQCVLVIVKIGLIDTHVVTTTKHNGNVVISENTLRDARNQALLWKCIAYVILFLNAFADLLYSQDLGIVQSWAFCGVLFVCTFYFGTFGIMCITAGLNHTKVR